MLVENFFLDYNEDAMNRKVQNIVLSNGFVLG